MTHRPDIRGCGFLSTISILLAISSPWEADSMRALLTIRLPKDDEGGFIDVKEFRRILQAMGLRPFDMPSDEGDEAEAKIKDYCSTRAVPIFERMPEHDEDAKQRKMFSKANIVYAGDLAVSGTLFMVTAHSQSEYRFRLLNPKIESLQEGCRDLIVLIRDFNAVHPNRQLSVVGKIQLYEHGLEESTISGEIVQSRWRTTRSLAGRDVLITVTGLVLFFLLTALTISQIIPEGNARVLVERLSTAMFTATVVSGLSVYYTYRNIVPIVQWTATYEKKQ